jgi:tetratricopeptide (TPR) repeat protein
MSINEKKQSGKKPGKILRSPYTWLTFLLFCTLLAYSNTFHVPFIFDDVDNLTNNPYMRFQTLSWDYIKNLPHGLNGKRIVSFITFGLNYYVDQYNVVGYHLVNILIHLFNGLLLFFLIRIILSLTNHQNNRYIAENTTEKQSSRDDYIAIFATGLWLLNPIQIFSVTYTVQRMNSLAAMFSMLSLLSYIRTRGITFRGEQKKQSALKPLSRYLITLFFILLTFIFAIFAILSKQNAILLPIFIILFELYFLSDYSFKNIISRLRRPKFLIFSLLIIAPVGALLTYIIYYNTAANPWAHIMSLYNGRDFSFFERIITQPRIVCYYLSLIFYPVPSRLALLVDIPKSTGFLHPVSTLISIIFLASLFILSLIAGRRSRSSFSAGISSLPNKSDSDKSDNSTCELQGSESLNNSSSQKSQCSRASLRLFSFAVVWFLAGHLLESTIIPLELVYIHRNYLPSIFIFLPIAVYFFQWSKKTEMEPGSAIWRFRKLEFLALSMFLFACWTYSYNSVWKTEVLFWADNVKKSPALPRTYANYGAMLIKAGDYSKAHKALDKALTFKPGDVRTLYNKGAAYEGEKNYKEAIKYYSKALKINPKFADAWSSQGNVLVEIGYIDKGLQCLYAAWELQPFDTVVNYRLGHTLMITNNSKGAMFHLHRAEKSNPYYINALLDLGLIYTILNNDEVANSYFSRVKRLDPSNKLANDMLKMKSFGKSSSGIIKKIK